jgi:uncharacterized protein (DUF305 family)
MNNKQIIIIFLLFVIMCMKKNTILEGFNSPCSDKITNNEYLLHMIPHHQVAIDMSVILQKITQNPKMHQILRNIIWTQQYEIDMMKNMLHSLPNDMSDNTMKMNKKYITTVASFTKPTKINMTNAYCDPDFFDPKAHMKKMKDMKLNDKMYIAHMIPHHQVAIDMSKKLLKNTNNDFMIFLCYRIIRSQEEEVIMLSDLKKNLYIQQSKLIY